MKKVFNDSLGFASFFQDLPKSNIVFMHDPEPMCVYDGEGMKTPAKTTLYARKGNDDWTAVDSDGISYVVSEFYLFQLLIEFCARNLDKVHNGSMLCYGDCTLDDGESLSDEKLLVELFKFYAEVYAYDLSPRQ